jgi:hypothetical protein
VITRRSIATDAGAWLTTQICGLRAAESASATTPGQAAVGLK